MWPGKEWRRSGFGGMGHTINEATRSRRLARRRRLGMDARRRAWSERAARWRENFAGRFPANERTNERAVANLWPTSQQRSVLDQGSRSAEGIELGSPGSVAIAAITRLAPDGTMECRGTQAAGRGG